MWLGAIRLRVKTKNAPDAGTDSPVSATIIRDGIIPVFTGNFDWPGENDLERGAVRNYDYIGPTKLARINDQTPELTSGATDPMPYPPYGIEFSNGLVGHLTIQLRIHGHDMWIKDSIELFIQEIRVAIIGNIDDSGGQWTRDNFWTSVGRWEQDKAMSTDSDEGVTTWLLRKTS